MTVIPASVNFRLYIGATFNEVLTVRDSAGVLVNLTGYTARLQVRRDINDVSPVFTLATGGTGIVLGGVLGTVTLTYTAAQTAALVVDMEGEAWVYDLQLINGALVDRFIQGALFVLPAVTR